MDFRKQQIDVKALPYAGHRTVLDFTCSTLEPTISMILCPVNIEVRTDKKRHATALCQETRKCKKLQKLYD